MNIFLTGGTGFIGSHFLARAIGAKHNVMALRRPGSTPRISLPHEPVWLEGKLEDDWSLQLQKCQTLVHLAAAGVNPQKAKWEDVLQVNIIHSLNLWRQAAKAGVKRFVICGSCFEYGKSGERYEFIPADAPLEPVNAYAVSKAAATLAAVVLAKEQKIELIILRPFHVFGEGEEESRFWPSLRKAALAGPDFPMTAGEQIRDFVPVEMVAEKFIAALERTDLRDGIPKIENVGTGKPQTLRKFAEYWWDKWKAKGKLKFGVIPYRNDEIMRYVPQI